MRLPFLYISFIAFLNSCQEDVNATSKEAIPNERRAKYEYTITSEASVDIQKKLQSDLFNEDLHGEVKRVIDYAFKISNSPSKNNEEGELIHTTIFEFNPKGDLVSKLQFNEKNQLIDSLVIFKSSSKLKVLHLYNSYGNLENVFTKSIDPETGVILKLREVDANGVFIEEEHFFFKEGIEKESGEKIIVWDRKRYLPSYSNNEVVGIVEWATTNFYKSDSILFRSFHTDKRIDTDTIQNQISQEEYRDMHDEFDLALEREVLFTLKDSLWVTYLVDNKTGEKKEQVRYIYEYDKRGNWIKRYAFSKGDFSINRVREIQYFE